MGPQGARAFVPSSMGRIVKGTPGRGNWVMPRVSCPCLLCLAICVYGRSQKRSSASRVLQHAFRRPRQQTLYASAFETLCGELPDETFVPTFVPRPWGCRRYRATSGVALVGRHDVCCAKHVYVYMHVCIVYIHINILIDKSINR